MAGDCRWRYVRGCGQAERLDHPKSLAVSAGQQRSCRRSGRISCLALVSCLIWRMVCGRSRLDRRQAGIASLQQQRARRQMVFSAGEVLLLLRQVLPVFHCHSDDLVHGAQSSPPVAPHQRWIAGCIERRACPAAEDGCRLDGCAGSWPFQLVALLDGPAVQSSFKSRKAGAGSLVSSSAGAVAYGGSEPPFG